jgi:hypothetical protein
MIISDQSEIVQSNKEQIKNVIDMCEYLARTNNASKSELSNQFHNLNSYLDWFHNHVGTILNDPETTIDMQFKKDLDYRTRAST